MREPKLKPQLKLVATYYMGEALGNAEKSCIMAGYSERYARGNAYKLIQKKEVQEYIKYLKSLSELNVTKHIATITEIQGFWTDVMNNGECRTADRLKASELLAKANGMFNADNW
jgi:phage terminase small subunit